MAAKRRASEAKEPPVVVVEVSEDEAKEKRAALAELLDSLGKTLSAERSDAIRHRTASGIEQDWTEDEEHYDGIDDANRGEHSSAWRTRPAGQAVTKKKGNLQSSIFLNITRPGVNVAAARVCNILMPRVSLKPTPVPELIELSKGEMSKPMLDHIGTQFAGQPEKAANAAEQAVREAMRITKESTAKAGKAQKRMEDWFVEGRYYAQNRMMIKDSAKVGSGVLKGPIPEKVRRVAFKEGKLVVDEQTKPVTKRVDYWNFYPDPACGENIHDGSFTWEKDAITRKKLRGLKGGDYLDDQIDLVLTEGPMRAIAPTKQNQPSLEVSKGPFEIWYRYGELTKDQMESMGCECKEGATVPALLTMVNEHVIKAALNPLDNGSFPYDVFAWPQKRKGMPWGTGIARAGRTPQRITAAAVRAMMDNAGRSAGPQVIKGTQVTPNNNVNEIVPWKLWDYAEDGDLDDVRKAFAFIEVPMRQQELANIIAMGIKWMEESTNMPMLLQGQQGGAPDLVGVAQILNANASEFLRDLGSSYDDDISEPHGARYYEWLLQHGDDDEKGEFVLDTRGASVKVEQLLQDQELLKAMQMSLNPVFKKDPAKFMDEYLTSRHFNPKDFEYDDEEWKKIVANMQKGDPRTAIAQMRAQMDEKLLAMQQQFEAAENEKDRENKLAVSVIDERMKSTELTSNERETLAKIKAELAGTAMKLNVQQKLSADAESSARDQAVAGHKVDIYKHRNPTPQIMKPPTEPTGKARAGRAFTQ